MNNKIIKINCPNCDEKLIIELDNGLNVISININEVELSSVDEINKELNKRGIEFG